MVAICSNINTNSFFKGKLRLIEALLQPGFQTFKKEMVQNVDVQYNINSGYIVLLDTRQS